MTFVSKSGCSIQKKGGTFDLVLNQITLTYKYILILYLDAGTPFNNQ